MQIEKALIDRMKGQAKIRFANLRSKALVGERLPSLFVLSTGRAGSTMLMKVLSKCDHVSANHELSPDLYRLRKEVYEKEAYDSADYMPYVFQGTRLKRMLGARLRGKAFADTSPFLSFFSPALHRRLPNSKFIYMHRHPEAFVLSGLRRGWYERHGHDRYRLVPKRGTEAYDLWPTWSRFCKICWLWNEYNRVCADCFERLDPDRRLEMPCEMFWGDPRQSLQRIFEFMKVEVESIEPFVACMRKPVNAQKPNREREPSEWSDHEWRQLDSITEPMATRLGYAATRRAV